MASKRKYKIALVGTTSLRGKEDRFPRSFWIWTVADNLTRGSALNALEVARALLAYRNAS